MDQLRAKRLTVDPQDAATEPTRIEIKRILPYVEDLKGTLATAPVKTQRFILKSFIKEIVVKRGEIAMEFSLPQQRRSPDGAGDAVLSTVTSGTPESRK